MFFAILAGVVSAAFWGILYIFPLLLPEYSSFQTGIVTRQISIQEKRQKGSSPFREGKSG